MSKNEVKILKLIVHDLGKRNRQLKQQIKALKHAAAHLERNLQAITVNKINNEP